MHPHGSYLRSLNTTTPYIQLGSSWAHEVTAFFGSHAHLVYPPFCGWCVVSRRVYNKTAKSPVKNTWLLPKVGSGRWHTGRTCGVARNDWFTWLSAKRAATLSQEDLENFVVLRSLEAKFAKRMLVLFGSSTSLHYLSIDFSHIFECLQSVYICLYRKCLLAHMFVSNIYAFLSLKYCLILFPDSILDTSISLLVVVLFKFLAATRSTFLNSNFWTFWVTLNHLVSSLNPWFQAVFIELHKGFMNLMPHGWGRAARLPLQSSQMQLDTNQRVIAVQLTKRQHAAQTRKKASVSLTPMETWVK